MDMVRCAKQATPPNISPVRAACGARAAFWMDVSPRTPDGNLGSSSEPREVSGRGGPLRAHSREGRAGRDPLKRSDLCVDCPWRGA